MAKSQSIKVSVFKRSGRRYYEMQYRDPKTGQKVRRSTGETVRRLAERAAAKWEEKVRLAAGDVEMDAIAWAEFRLLYEEEHLSSLAAKTDEKVSAVLNVFESLMSPVLVADIDESVISKYQTALRAQPVPSHKKGAEPKMGRMRSESTIRSHVDHLMAALGWAKGRKLISRVPGVRKPKRAKKASGQPMKGRPITTEEFERMLAATPEVVGQRDADSWRFFLRGLWLSGLRLAESMQLHWTDRSKLCVIDIDSREPLLSIPAELEKGNEDRLLPIAPEFVEFLRAIPDGQRAGYVFNPRPRRVRYGARLSNHHVGKVVSRIGRKAGVVVHIDVKSRKRKFASAHDLRRSFGDRWSRRVMPTVLKELMRHESVETTMRYYVETNAKATSAILWDVHRKSGTHNGTQAGLNRENTESNANTEEGGLQ